MKTIAVMTRKGGAGKTTLVTALLSAALNDGKRCLAIDMDPQRSLFRWVERTKMKSDQFECAAPASFGEMAVRIETERENGSVDYIFIDTMGAAGDWADELAINSDALIVPMMLSRRDLDITIDTFNWYCNLHKRTQNPEDLPVFKVVLSGVTTKQTKAQESIENDAIKMFPVMEDYFMKRNQHLVADDLGFLHQIAQQTRKNPKPLIRTHAKHFDEAVEEATSILQEIERDT